MTNEIRQGFFGRYFIRINVFINIKYNSLFKQTNILKWIKQKMFIKMKKDDSNYKNTN